MIEKVWAKIKKQKDLGNINLKYYCFIKRKTSKKFKKIKHKANEISKNDNNKKKKPAQTIIYKLYEYKVNKEKGITQKGKKAFKNQQKAKL